MAYPESQVVMGGLVHIPVIIGVFWALNNLTTGGKKAAEAAAKQAAEEAAAKAAAEAAAAKKAAEAAAAKKAAETAAPATTAVAPVSGEAEASQASNNDTQATPAPDQEVL